jgi:hypothetical protein
MSLSWIVSRTASEVATHQSRDVAEAAGLAKVEIKCRRIKALKASELTFKSLEDDDEAFCVKVVGIRKVYSSECAGI